MANTIDNAWGKGVIYAASIDLAAQKPLDSRISVQTIAERDAHVTNNRAYEGMIVHVVDEGKTYELKGGVWKEILDADHIVNNLTTNDATKVLSAAQGKALKDQIDSVAGGTLTVPVATEDKIGGIKSSSAELNEVSVSPEGIASVSRVSSADKLTEARTISLAGDATGSVSFDGSANATLTVTVTDNSHAHTIANVTGLQDALDLKAPLESPALTGTPTAPTAAEGTNTTQLATTAFVKTAIDKHISEVATALIFKGIVDSTHALPESGMRSGWLYVVGEAGTYGGQKCEAGDMIVYASDAWYVIQKNIDGAVTGPTSAVDTHVAAFDGTTGKLIKDSGYTIAQSVPAESVWKIGDDVTNSVHGLMTPALKTKLDGIATGAEVNQNAISKIKVGSTTLSSDSKTDTFELAAENGVTLSAAGKKITITGTTYSDATQSAHGLMTAADKTKLDGIAAGAEVNVQADWNESNDSSDAFIKNKPTKMASPYGLTVTAGSKSVSYDGSSTKSITITSSDISAMPLLDSGTAANLVKIASTGNTLEDAGFTLPAPSTDTTGKYLGVNSTGAYEIKTITMSDIESLVSTLATKVDKLTSGVKDNVMVFGTNGAIVDSGVSFAKIPTTDDTITFQCTL